MKDSKEEYVWVQNVPLEELDDRSFIQYWECTTCHEFGYADYLCLATPQLYKRDDLDGTHVKIVDSNNDAIYITPVRQLFNRSKSDRQFQVKKKHLVMAPKQAPETKG